MWVKIPDYDYEVSDKGEIRRIGGGTLKKLTLDKSNGYLKTSLWRNNVGRTFFVHRLVAAAFVDGDTELTVNHIDGNKQNNTPDNLEWITKADNTRHQHESGLANAATQYKPTKIPPEDYYLIVDRYDEGEPCDFIAADYDCSQPLISWVIRKAG